MGLDALPIGPKFTEGGDTLAGSDNSEYQRKAKIIRETATQCWLCGNGYNPADPWQADHVNPRAINSVLLPAHRSCNIRRAHGLPPAYPPRQQPGEGSKLA